jgi:EmrB/QacA subfamily drug resistance transporter
MSHRPDDTEMFTVGHVAATTRLMRSRVASPSLITAIACAGMVLANVDLYVVNLALPNIGHSLNDTSLSALSWVIDGYTIVYAALQVPAGRLADRYGQKHGFLLGAAIFTAATMACGLAVDLPMLITFRLVQAAGAALLSPTSLSLVLAAYPDEKRARAVHIWSAAGGIGATLGPVVGGLLLEATWRGVFFVSVPVGIAAIVAGAWLLPSAPGHRAALPDPVGAVLGIAAVGALTFGLVQGGTWGWGTAGVIGTLIASAVGLALFVVHTLRSPNPVIDPTLFGIRNFSVGSIVLAVFCISFGGMLLSINLWEQSEWDWSALKTGLAIVPGTLISMVFAAFVAGWLIRRFRFAVVAAVGSLTMGIGLVWWAVAATVTPDYTVGVLGGIILVGAGSGLALATLFAAATSSLPHAAATGSAAVGTFRQVSLAIGIAIFVAILGTPHSSSARQAAFDHGWIALATLAFAAAIVAMLLRQPAATSERG